MACGQIENPCFDAFLLTQHQLHYLQTKQPYSKSKVNDTITTAILTENSEACETCDMVDIVDTDESVDVLLQNVNKI